MRDFCKPISLTKEQLKEWNDIPKMEYWFNCRGECLFYENGILIGKQKKDGSYINLLNNNKPK